jgi:hypothetical protein
MAVMTGIHVVIVPSWWPSPEQPINGIFHGDYARAFAAAGAKSASSCRIRSVLDIWGRHLHPGFPNHTRTSPARRTLVIRIRGCTPPSVNRASR